MMHSVGRNYYYVFSLGICPLHNLELWNEIVEIRSSSSKLGCSISSFGCHYYHIL